MPVNYQSVKKQPTYNKKQKQIQIINTTQVYSHLLFTSLSLTRFLGGRFIISDSGCS